MSTPVPMQLRVVSLWFYNGCVRTDVPGMRTPVQGLLRAVISRFYSGHTPMDAMG